MKRFLPLVIGVFILIFLIHFCPVRADFNQAYQDYVNQYDRYRKDLTAFLTAKNRYFTYKTLVSQNEALSATKTFLEARDETLVVYLKMLLERNPQTDLKPIVDDEITFYENHKGRISAIATLKDADQISQKVDEHLPATEITSKKFVAKVIIDKVRTLENRVTVAQNSYEEEINQIRVQGGNVTTAERWLLEARQKSQLCEEKLDGAGALTEKLQPSGVAYLGKSYGDIQQEISEANQYLKEAVSFLKEIKEELKYGNF
jgi:hypothetical protein